MWPLLRRVHKDQRGTVTLETILVLGAIALPMLLFLVKVAWPKIQDLFNKGFDQLDEAVQQNFP